MSALILALALVARAETPLDIHEAADQAVSALTSEEWDRAERLARDTLAALPDLDEPADRHALATLWQVLGTSYAMRPEAEPEAATANFSTSCAIAPGWFNSRLPEHAQRVWSTACPSSEAVGTLRVDAIPRGSGLWIDGQTLGRQRTHEVPPGQHLVQILGSDHPPYNELTKVDQDATTLLQTGFAKSRGPGPRISLGVGVGAGAGALAFGILSAVENGKAGAVLDSGIEGTDDPALDDLDRHYGAFQTYRGVAIGLGLLSAAGLGLSFTF